MGVETLRGWGEHDASQLFFNVREDNVTALFRMRTVVAQDNRIHNVTS